MEDEKKFHERVAQDRKPSVLPFTTRRKIENGIRCAVSTGLCIVASHFWPWAGPLTYLSPALSPITTVLYFGLWAENLWKISYSGVLCTIIGGIIGISKSPAVLLILELVALIWVEKCSLWDRLCKVIGALCLIVATLFGVITEWAYSPQQVISMIVAMILFTTLISGVSFLMVPYPAFAFYFVQVKITKVCRQLSAAIFALTRAFCSSEHVDLLNTEVEFIVADIEETLNSIDPLIVYANTESVLLDSMHNISAPATVFVAHCRKLLEEIRWLRYSLHTLAANKTQAKYVRNLRKPLLEISSEIDLLMGIHADYFSGMCLRPRIFASMTNLANWIHNLFGIFGNIDRMGGSKEDIEWRKVTLENRERAASLSVDLDAADDGEQYQNEFGDNSKFDRPVDSGTVDAPTNIGSIRFRSLEQRGKEISIDYAAASTRLSKATTRMIAAFQRSRIDYFHEWRAYRAESTQSIKAELRRKRAFSSGGGSSPGRGTSSSGSHNGGDIEISSNDISDDDFILDEAAKKMFLEETETLSLENFGPRSSYVCRIVATKDIIKEMISVFEQQSPARASIFAFFVTTCNAVIAYVMSFPHEWYYLFSLLRSYFQAAREEHNPEFKNIVEQSCTPRAPGKLNRKEARKLLLKLLKSYVQPTKISVAITLTSIFVVVPSIGSNSYLFTQNALWATIVIALVRQESTASSFLQSYQRLEGTVIGALFAFTTFQLMQCSSADNGRCSISSIAPVLVVWMFICNFFKEGARHGYAAVVAGLTPVILLLGPTTGTVEGAWLRLVVLNACSNIGLVLFQFARVMMTFLGIVIYLVIDNAIFPNRTDRSVRRSVIHSVEEISLTFIHSMNAFEQLTTSCGSSVIFNKAPLESSMCAQPAMKKSQVTFAVDASVARNVPVSVSLHERDRISITNNGIELVPPLLSSSPSRKSYLDATTDIENAMHVQDETELKSNNDTHAVPDTKKESGTKDRKILSIEKHLARVDRRIAELFGGSRIMGTSSSKMSLDNPFQVQLEIASACLSKFAKHIKDQRDRLNIGVFDPEIFRRSFPLQEYSNLLVIFDEIQHKSRAMINGLQTMSFVLTDAQAKYSQEELKFHMDSFSFIIQHISNVASKTEIAMKMACISMHRLFATNDLETDLTELVVLARSVARSRAICDHHFKYEYSTHVSIQHLDPMFTNVFQCVTGLTWSLTSLGAALHRIREVEIRSAT